ncbi:MAG: hypothetical protein KKE20_04690 [Nanoarchaeota archaeon]|nr:hypothetical protein [Nanoarchaeota archaeon]
MKHSKGGWLAGAILGIGAYGLGLAMIARPVYMSGGNANRMMVDTTLSWQGMLALISLVLIGGFLGYLHDLMSY